MTCIPLHVTQAERNNDVGAELFRVIGRAYSLALRVLLALKWWRTLSAQPSEPLELATVAKRYGPEK
jgi:hypothetical protein